MKSVTKRPLARSERVVIEAVGDETVIYDLDSSVAHALKPLAASVFMYADGSNDAAEIAELAAYRLGTTVTEDEVLAAIAELEQLSLLDAPVDSGMSRRDALKVFAAAGAGTMLVTSVAAPAAFAGTSQNGYPYICGSGSNNLHGNYGYPSVSWPQANPNVGTVGGPKTSGSYALGDQCNYSCGQSYCSYDGHKVYGVTKSECSSGFCYDTSNHSKCTKSQGGCGGHSNPYQWVKGTWNTTGQEYGTYQCVPCDGDLKKLSNGQIWGYQCCEVVCVPSSQGSVPGAVTSGSICPGGSSTCQSYYPYTQQYGGSWPNKYCTTNHNCNPGTCS